MSAITTHVLDTARGRPGTLLATPDTEDA